MITAKYFNNTRNIDVKWWLFRRQLIGRIQRIFYIQRDIRSDIRIFEVIFNDKKWYSTVKRWISHLFNGLSTNQIARSPLAMGQYNLYNDAECSTRNIPRCVFIYHEAEGWVVYENAKWYISCGARSIIVLGICPIPYYNETLKLSLKH